MEGGRRGKRGRKIEREREREAGREREREGGRERETEREAGREGKWGKWSYNQNGKIVKKM